MLQMQHVTWPPRFDNAVANCEHLGLVYVVAVAAVLAVVALRREPWTAPVFISCAVLLATVRRRWGLSRGRAAWVVVPHCAALGAVGGKPLALVAVACFGLAALHAGLRSRPAPTLDVEEGGGTDPLEAFRLQSENVRRKYGI